MNDADWEIFGEDLPEPRELSDETEDPHDGEECSDGPDDMQRLAGEIFLFDNENPFDGIMGMIFGR